jgi:hypothetical protein
LKGRIGSLVEGRYMEIDNIDNLNAYVIAFFFDGCEGLLFYSTILNTDPDGALRKLYVTLGARSKKMRVWRVVHMPDPKDGVDDGRTRVADKIYVHPYEESNGEFEYADGISL